YHGPRFYWSRYYFNHWWWYDAAFARWAFWADGYWWWPGPGGVMYVYVNDNYYPYETSEVPVAQPTSVPEPPSDYGTSGGGTASQDTTLKSPDGQRMVQIVGADSDAFLYDTSTGRSVFVKGLGRGATNVRFSGGANGQALQILVDF